MANLEEKGICSNCGVDVLKTTFESTGGYCMPCSRAAFKKRIESKKPEGRFLFSAPHLILYSKNKGWQKSIKVSAEIIAKVFDEMGLSIDSLTKRLREDPEGFFVKPEDINDPKVEETFIEWLNEPIINQSSAEADLRKRLRKTC